MNAAQYQMVSITCPQCRTPYTTPVVTVIDVGQNPDLKALFLSGQINIAVCPNCGHAGMLSAPLVYHDPAKELLFTFAPTDLGRSDMDQQRALGELTNRIITALPAEQRKAYLLQPRSFLQLEGMLDAILEADGVTPEMLEAQRAKAALLERLLQATSPEARQVIAQENNAQIDYEFFQLLTLNIEMAERAGQDEIAQSLLDLRHELLEWSTVGKEIADRGEAIRSLRDGITREELLEKIVEAALAGEQTKVETMVAVGRQGIDYLFYQQLTGRIEAAEASGEKQQAQELRALREMILDATAQMDAELERASREVDQQIDNLLESEDPEAELRSRPSLISDLFLAILGSRLQAATESGETEHAEELGRLHRAVFEVIQENQPPQVRLLSQLLSTEHPEEARALLEENQELIDETFLDMLESLGQELVGDEQDGLGPQLAQILKQATALIQG